MLSFLVQLAEGNHSFTNQRLNLISLILDFKALIFLCQCPHILSCFYFGVYINILCLSSGTIVGFVVSAKMRKINMPLP